MRVAPVSGMMNLDSILETFHTPAPVVDAPSKLHIVTVSSHGIKVATSDEDVMLVPWKVMRALAREGKEPYAGLFHEAQRVMLKRLASRRSEEGRWEGKRRSSLSPAHANAAEQRAYVAQADLSPSLHERQKEEAQKSASPGEILVSLSLPRDLVARAREKGRNLHPPMSLKWAVRLLLEDWIKER